MITSQRLLLTAATFYTISIAPTLVFWVLEMTGSAQAFQAFTQAMTPYFDSIVFVERFAAAVGVILFVFGLFMLKSRRAQ